MKVSLNVSYFTEDILMKIPKIELVKMFLGLSETPEEVKPVEEYRMSKERLDSMMLKVDTPWGNDKAKCPYFGVEYVSSIDAYRAVFEGKQVAKSKDPVKAAVAYDDYCDQLDLGKEVERNRDTFKEVRNYKGDK